MGSIQGGVLLPGENLALMMMTMMMVLLTVRSSSTLMLNSKFYFALLDKRFSKSKSLITLMISLRNKEIGPRLPISHVA